VPRQYSTGGKASLYGISKRGNCYLRKILIHGARAVVLRSKRDRIAIGEWMRVHSGLRQSGRACGPAGYGRCHRGTG
jgi:transposase